MKSKRISSRFAVSAAAVSIAAAALFALTHNLSASASAPVSPGSRTLFVDAHAIITGSKLGQNIQRQVLAYEDKVNADLGAEGQSLHAEAQDLQKQVPLLPPDIREKKIAAFQAKQAAYQQKVQARQSLIQGGQMLAVQRYNAALNPILHAILIERGGSILLFKSSVADSVGDVDITKAAIQRLDQKISSFKVPLVKPPANSIPTLQ
jgi:Skp family chaperone for outer membrane proteins